MLFILRIRNLVVVESLEIELSPLMNVLTGETGAGKSVILKGLELLAGARGNNDLIRAGAERCEVEGLFIVDDDTRSKIMEDCDWLTEHLNDDEIIIRRVLETSGRGKIYVNGRLTTLGELANLSALLIDITSQHQQRTLTDVSTHLTLLDQFGVPSELLIKVKEAYTYFSRARAALENFRGQNAAGADFFRRISFERDELRSAGIEAGERSKIASQLKELESCESRIEIVAECLSLLEDSDGGVLRNLSLLSNRISRIAQEVHDLQPMLEIVEGTEVQLRDISFILNSAALRMEVDPQEIERLRARLSDISRLERKYGRDDKELTVYLNEIDAKLADFELGAVKEEQLQLRLQETRAALDKLESTLTQERKNAGKKLSDSVEHELRELGMKQAEFAVAVAPAESSSQGADKVEFLFSANPGEPPRSLSRVASGGEMSRVLLILKTILNERKGSIVQVFDEIDTGIGGAVAQVVGEKIKSLTPRYQAVLVTHAPQIAGLADRHFLIEKILSLKQSETEVRVLDRPERVKEIARMLAGKNVSASFEKSAMELISEGEKRNPYVASRNKG